MVLFSFYSTLYLFSFTFTFIFCIYFIFLFFSFDLIWFLFLIIFIYLLFLKRFFLKRKKKRKAKEKESKRFFFLEALFPILFTRIPYIVYKYYIHSMFFSFRWEYGSPRTEFQPLFCLFFYFSIRIWSPDTRILNFFNKINIRVNFFFFFVKNVALKVKFIFKKINLTSNATIFTKKIKLNLIFILIKNSKILILIYLYKKRKKNPVLNSGPKTEFWVENEKKKGKTKAGIRSRDPNSHLKPKSVLWM